MDPQSQRLVLEPTAIAVVHAGGSRQSALPPTVSIGGPPSQNEELLVRFARTWEPTDIDIDSAFLLLEPALDAEPSAADVEVGVTLIASDWTSGVLTEVPSRHGPTSTGWGRTRPPALLRVDVTAQLRELVKAPRGDRGLLVHAVEPSSRGAIYSTGLDGGAPRLEVYFRVHHSRR